MKLDTAGTVLDLAIAVRRVAEPPFDGTRPWRELGIDSLDLVELLVRLEDALGVEVPDRVAARLATPAALAEWVSRAARG